MDRKMTKVEKIKNTKSDSKSSLKFKIWQPAETFLVYQILEAKNIPDDSEYHYTSVDIEYDLLHPEKVVKNYEGIEIFSLKEDRQAFVCRMIKNLKKLFSKTKVTEKNIGNEVETEYGVAKLVALTTTGEYIVTFKFTGSELHKVSEVWISDYFNKKVLADSSEIYSFSV